MTSGPVVVKIGGTMIEDAATAPALWRAIADLHRSRPSGVVVVHGGGASVDRRLEQLGMPTRRREGIRLTPADQLDEIVSVLAGRLNKSIVAALHRLGVRAVGLCLGDGDAVPTALSTRFSFDPGRVGDVVDTQTGGASRGPRGENLVGLLLASGYLPVLSSIGIDREGFLNVNADDAAAGAARVIGASDLVLLTDVAGILDGSGRVVESIDSAGIEGLIGSGAITGGMIVKARAAARTARRLGSPVVILSGAGAGDLEKWVAGHQAGTRVKPD
ncbi:MAG: acetylglutamate kinase [Phycisphaeraceae bacterium]|nr:acetylglutamate kinase [Phycisphaerae bacterium]MBX3392312.1 acetylglutamate kinase [Phycisphaeraceae bacterium]HRJ49054.1 acetylglutamate kinase [Phycisphaerales bacterium]